MTTPSASPSTTSATQRQQLMILTLAIMGGLVMIAVVTVFVLELATPPWWALGAVLVLLGASLVLVDLLDRRMPPLSPGADAGQAWGRVRAAHLVRMAVLEAPAIAGLALAFVVGSWWVYAVGALISVIALAVLALPRGPVLARFEEALNADGAQVSLRG